MNFTRLKVGPNITEMSRANELMKRVPYSRLVAFSKLPADSLVRVYSYQQEEALGRMETYGYLTGPIDEAVDEYFRPAYDWMREQMAKRIINYTGEYPVWAWTKRCSSKNKVRKYRGTKESVRITAMVPKSRILLSDYERWHSPLNDSPVLRTEAEFDTFHGDPQPTWERVFDFTPPTDPKEIYWRGAGKYYRVQACIDRIYPHEIVNIKVE